jgi:hypothetical protein
MNRIDRAAWKRIKARVAAPKPPGNVYPGTIKSITIDGRPFPVLEGAGRFSIEELFKVSDVRSVVGRIG